jgi:hypothetical protein
MKSYKMDVVKAAFKNLFQIVLNKNLHLLLIGEFFGSYQ